MPTPAKAAPAPAAEAAAAYTLEREPGRIRGLLLRHGRSLCYLLPVLAIAAVVQGFGMAGSPQRDATEGAMTAQAWSLLRLGGSAASGEAGQLAASVPGISPLAELQLAGYTALTGAFGRYEIAVIAAREAMLVFALLSVVLVWALARRVNLTHPAAAAAALVFALSPLAVQLHRTVSPGNVAVPWLLAAFLLALARRHQPVAFAGSALAFSIAFLSLPAVLLALPFLAWTMVRTARPGTRRTTLPIAAGVTVVASLLIPALLTGRLLDLDPVRWFVAPSASATPLSSLQTADAVLLLAGGAAAILALFLRRLRPIAGLVLAVLLVSGLALLPPGGAIPGTSVILVAPFLAILLAGVVDEAVQRVRSREKSYWRRMGRRSSGVLVLAAAIAAVAIAIPSGIAQLRSLMQTDPDRPARQAEAWVSANIPANSRVIVDDALWVDLVNDGYEPGDVIRSSAQASSSNGWRDSDFIVATDALRTLPPAAASDLRGALENSQVVASFGTGSRAVDVRRIAPDGLAAAAAAETERTAERAGAGTQLLANRRLTLTPEARRELAAGHVDARLILLLGQLSGSVPLSVTTMPPFTGETGPLRRSVIVSTGSDDGDQSLSGSLRAMSGVYAPDVDAADGGVLLTFSAVEPDVLDRPE